MTDRGNQTNPLMHRGNGGNGGAFGGKPEAYVRINDVMVPCTWDEFVAYMNKHNKRNGTYGTKYLRDETGRIIGRELDWNDHIGTESYRRNQAAGKRSERPAMIQHYVSDYGRADP